MRIDIITIFPELFSAFLSSSLLKKAQENGIIRIKAHNLRDFSKDKHRTVDNRPYGGERGMIFKLEPIFRAVSSLKIPNSKFQISNKSQASNSKQRKTKVILFTPRGKKFSQKLAAKWAKLDQLILICGRYEGVDERVAKHIADEVVSIGDYVLMGGEIPAMAIIEAVCRLVPGVVGKSEELSARIGKNKGFIEYPQYTRPEKFEYQKGKSWKAPKVLLSGDHKKIKEWRRKHSRNIE